MLSAWVENPRPAGTPLMTYRTMQQQRQQPFLVQLGFLTGTAVHFVAAASMRQKVMMVSLPQVMVFERRTVAVHREKVDRRAWK